MDADDIRRELEESAPFPEVPVVLGVPSEITMLQRHYEDSEAGRVRNARTALVAVIVALLLVLATGVSLGGWYDTSRSLEQRNRAVHQLTVDGITEANIVSCRADALGTAFDDALVDDDYERGRLLRWYAMCESTKGERFR